jgi:hypothetical protein
MFETARYGNMTNILLKGWTIRYFAFKVEVQSSPVPGQQELAKQMVELSLSDPIQTGEEGRVESVKTSC